MESHTVEYMNDDKSSFWFFTDELVSQLTHVDFPTFNVCEQTRTKVACSKAMKWLNPSGKPRTLVFFFSATSIV